jgi:hypothetical protein
MDGTGGGIMWHFGQLRVDGGGFICRSIDHHGQVMHGVSSCMAATSKARPWGWSAYDKSQMM